MIQHGKYVQMKTMLLYFALHTFLGSLKTGSLGVD